MTERPEHFKGTVTIAWTPGGPSPMPGWRFMISDEDGTPITTVTELAVHASADSTVWAEMTMFCTPDGKPILAGDIGSPPCYGTFAFEVASMAVREPARPVASGAAGHE